MTGDEQQPMVPRLCCTSRQDLCCCLAAHLPSLVFLLQREEEPRPGDMIEISHQFYCTWALYVGEGDVIHLAPPGKAC